MAANPALPHSGKLIRKHLEELGMTKSELARRLDTSPQNVYGIFQRKTCDVSILHRVSLILNTDLVQYYCTEAMSVPEKNGTGNTTSVGQLRKQLEAMTHDRDAYKRECDYLKEILALMKEKSGAAPKPNGKQKK